MMKRNLYVIQNTEEPTKFYNGALAVDEAFSVPFNQAAIYFGYWEAFEDRPNCMEWSVKVMEARMDEWWDQEPDAGC